MTVQTTALSHLRQLDALASVVADDLARVWRGAKKNNLEGSFTALAPVIAAMLAEGQRTAASYSDGYLDAVQADYGDSGSQGSVVPGAFAGADRAGLEVVPDLYGSVLTTKRLLGNGWQFADAFQAGATEMTLMAKTIVSDTGRSADQVAMNARGYTQYVRVVQPGACSRCAILAGIQSSKTAFKRHVSCRCTSAPYKTGTKGFTTPDEFFDSLSRAEQDARFTKAGAQAIRDGANPVSVVTARRGTNLNYRGRTELTAGQRRRLQPVTVGKKADGTPLRVFATTESTTKSAAWGARHSGQIRLMPEEIYRMSDDHDEIVRLLGHFGYLD